MAKNGNSTADASSSSGDVCSHSQNSSSKKRKSNFKDRAESRSSSCVSVHSSVEDDDVASSRIESPVRYAFGVGNGKTYHDEYASAPEKQGRAPLIPATCPCCGSYEFPDKTIDCVAHALSSFNEKNKAQQGPEYKLVSFFTGCVRHPKPRIYHFNFAARAKETTAAEQPKNELFFAEVEYALREDGKVGPCVRCCCILGHQYIMGLCKLAVFKRLGLVAASYFVKLSPVSCSILRMDSPSVHDSRMDQP